MDFQIKKVDQKENNMNADTQTIFELRRVLDTIAKKYGEYAKITIYEDGSGKISPQNEELCDNEVFSEFDGLGELMELLNLPGKRPIELACLRDTNGRTWDTVLVDIPINTPSEKISEVAFAVADKKFGKAMWTIYDTYESGYESI